MFDWGGRFPFGVAGSVEEVDHHQHIEGADEAIAIWIQEGCLTRGRALKGSRGVGVDIVDEGKHIEGADALVTGDIFCDDRVLPGARWGEATEVDVLYDRCC